MSESFVLPSKLQPKLTQPPKGIKNTRHSSGLWVNVKNINSIDHDEYPDDSSGTHQGVIS